MDSSTLRILLLVGTVAGAGACGQTQVQVPPGQRAPGSPSLNDATINNPVIVTRDNPTSTGWLTLYDGESSYAAPPYSYNGEWGATKQTVWGHVDAYEYTREIKKVDSFTSLFLPIPGNQTGTASGKIADWAVRSFDLVHDNVYQITAHYWSDHDSSATVTKPLSVRLSDDVMLVPVVLVILQRAAGADALPLSYPGATAEMKAMFDFIPYTGSTNSFGFPDLPSTTLPATVDDPSKEETPPDDVWSQCNIQFQVIANVTLVLPASFTPTCAATPTNEPIFLHHTDLINKVRAALPQARASEIVDTLKPIYAVYGNMGCGYWLIGKGYGDTAEVDLQNRAGMNVTAHELGHVLGLDHFTGIKDDLMSPTSYTENVNLAAWQCKTAYENAAYYSKRYDAYNIAIGRAAPPPPKPPAQVTPGSSATITVPAPICCQTSSGYSSVSQAMCDFLKGTKTYDTNKCDPDPKVCCLVGNDVQPVKTSQCQSVQADSACDSICCAPSGDPMTRYACVHSGGTPNYCPPS